MANIILKDLTNLPHNSSFIQDLSTEELGLQGGRRYRPAPVLPVPEVSNWPTPSNPSFDGFFPIVANFYI